MSTRSHPPIIYNLFPRHFASIGDWREQLPHIAEMGFNAVFVNPFFETGFSGSLYAVKDYYRLNPLFLDNDADPSDFTPVEQFREACGANGIDLIVDLVINHTAFDSVLTDAHPGWYKRDEHGNPISPFAVDPGNPENVTVWGDLASIDNENSDERDALWEYWNTLIAFLQKKGIHGFRCDAAYQVPMELWCTLIASARRRHPAATFYAETLGCTQEQIDALAPAGFDYLFNSVKWWNYDAPWALEQHAANQCIAPSIAFPESHDTERLASVPPGTLQMQKSRYAFAALFSRGVLMPQGFEYGAVTRMDVVKGRPGDVDPVQWDLSAWIAAINQLKNTVPVLGEEGNWLTLNPYSEPYLFLEKTSDADNPSIMVCVNKLPDAETVVEEWMVPQQVRNCSRAVSLLEDRPSEEPVPEAFTLDPADVVLFLP